MLFFLSWDFSTVAFLPEEALVRPTRYLLYGYWTRPWYHYSTFQFIYEWIPRPSVTTLASLQLVVAGAAALGLLGVFPKWMAWVVFLIGTHLLGMFLPGNDTMDGSATAALFLIFLLAIAPRACFYGFNRPFRPRERHERYHWPIFQLVLFLSAYYFVAGLNKILDATPNWPNVVRIDYFSEAAIQKSIFLSSWWTSIWFSELLTNYYLALVAAWLIFVFELTCPIILFVPRLIPVYLLPLAGMHMGIYFSHGYGYFVNAATDVLATVTSTMQRMTFRTLNPDVRADDALASVEVPSPSAR